MTLRYARRALLFCSALVAIPALADTPQSLTSKLKAILAETHPSCVAISVGGSASGVIISREGLANEAGEVKLDQQAMVDHMTRDTLAIAKKQPISMGLDDPGLAGTLAIKTGEGQTGVTRTACEETWDLAILEIEGNHKLQPITWPPSPEDIAAGDLVIAPDRLGRIRWNVATDSEREMKSKRSIGPLKDKSIISKHRAPYPLVIRHALPLGATDAGTPVFDGEGNFVGMHIARYSRTMGLIIPAEQLEEQVKSLLEL